MVFPLPNSTANQYCNYPGADTFFFEQVTGYVPTRADTFFFYFLGVPKHPCLLVKICTIDKPGVSK